ncbi:unnamed protein product [Allacma fusca]|uniref:Uncharacterized protein n=1 Tax=Allacma fusca TaxID=39272 RepID=A0A8J2JLU1_9HEXA|nr:unnamed protein product [Allacma fusca]
MELRTYIKGTQPTPNQPGGVSKSQKREREKTFFSSFDIRPWRLNIRQDQVYAKHIGNISNFFPVNPSKISQSRAGLEVRIKSVRSN